MSELEELRRRLAEAERLLRDAVPILELLQGDDEDIGPAYNELMYGIDYLLDGDESC